MGHLRFPDGVGAGLLLESAIGPGQPVLALSHKLCPGADEVGLDESRGFAAVSEQFPAQGSGAPAGAPDVAHRFGERASAGAPAG